MIICFKTNIENDVIILGHVLVQFHTAFVSCRHIRSVLYVAFCLFVANKFDLI